MLAHYGPFEDFGGSVFTISEPKLFMHLTQNFRFKIGGVNVFEDGGTFYNLRRRYGKFVVALHLRCEVTSQLLKGLADLSKSYKEKCG